MQFWELWYPEAASTGLAFARGHLESTPSCGSTRRRRRSLCVEPGVSSSEQEASQPFWP